LINFAEKIFFNHKIQKLFCSKSIIFINKKYMFFECSSLKEIKFGDKWNTGKVKNMNAMFYECGALENINISNWDIRKVTNKAYMFDGCEKIKNNIPDKFK